MPGFKVLDLNSDGNSSDSAGKLLCLSLTQSVVESAEHDLTRHLVSVFWFRVTRVIKGVRESWGRTERR